MHDIIGVDFCTDFWNILLAFVTQLPVEKNKRELANVLLSVDLLAANIYAHVISVDISMFPALQRHPDLSNCTKHFPKQMANAQSIKYLVRYIYIS